MNKYKRLLQLVLLFADAILANTAAFMAWNLCAKLTNTTDEESETDATV
jgi:hypothetical protein